MDRDTKRFVREAKRETRLLIEQCSYITPDEPTTAEGSGAETFDRETEVMIRSSMGGSANLGFFLPYLWKHRH